MLHQSENIQLVHHEHWAGSRRLLTNTRASECLVIITVDVTVV